MGEPPGFLTEPVEATAARADPERTCLVEREKHAGAPTGSGSGGQVWYPFSSRGRKEVNSFRTRKPDITLVVQGTIQKVIPGNRKAVIFAVPIIQELPILPIDLE